MNSGIENLFVAAKNLQGATDLVIFLQNLDLIAVFRQNECTHQSTYSASDRHYFLSLVQLIFF